MDPLFLAPPRPSSPYAPIRGPLALPRRTSSGGLGDPRRVAAAEREAEIARIARQLARVVQPLRWRRVQTDTWDACCHFIFRRRSYDSVRRCAGEVAVERGLPLDDFVAYATRRWFCFWGARVAELLFLSYPNVQPGPPKDHEVDFRIDGRPFDLKTSELPSVFSHRLADLADDPATIAAWFYRNQSRERRFHLANRLFLVLADPEQPEEAWRLRGDVGALRDAIASFMARPRLFELWVADPTGEPRKVVSGVIPVIHATRPRQLRLTLERAEVTAPPTSETPPSATSFQIALPLDGEELPSRARRCLTWPGLSHLRRDGRNLVV